jgi:peroxiredoxin
VDVTIVAVGFVLTWIALGLVGYLSLYLVKQYGRVLLELDQIKQGRVTAGAAPVATASAGLAVGGDTPLLAPAGLPGQAVPAPAPVHVPTPNGSLADWDYAAQTARQVGHTGLPLGTPASAFKLPRPDGRLLALDEFRGQRVLLVFSDPDCEPCAELAPDLERIHRQSAARLAVLMVSRGTAEANTSMIARHGLTFPVVLQQRWEVSRAYGIVATPVAFLLDERTVVAADVAVGRDAILALAARGDGS